VLLPLDTKSKQDINQNAQAFVNLTLACKEDVIFGLLDEATLTYFGDTRITWAGFKQRFEPSTGAGKVQKKSEFQQMKLDKAED
jgi:hypothetical protein